MLMQLVIFFLAALLTADGGYGLYTALKLDDTNEQKKDLTYISAAAIAVGGLTLIIALIVMIRSTQNRQ